MAGKWKKIAAVTGKNLSTDEIGRGIYTVKKLAEATGYKFKVSAYAKHNGRIYEGEKSETIKSATAPKELFY